MTRETATRLTNEYMNLYKNVRSLHHNPGAPAERLVAVTDRFDRFCAAHPETLAIAAEIRRRGYRVPTMSDPERRDVVLAVFLGEDVGLPVDRPA